MGTFTRVDQEQMEKAKDLLETAPAREMGFVKSLFFGRLALEKVMPYPQQDAADAQRMMDLKVRLAEFLKTNVDAAKIDAEERIGPEVVTGLGKLGVLGMTVPVEYGGGGFSHTAYCKVLEQIGGHCASTAVVVGAHQSIGLKAVLLMGTEAQKREYLPALACGEKLAAFCLSEPEVGSDAANVQTRAEPAADGRSWILNGEKKYATNGALAGMMTVLAKTRMEEGGKVKDKITAFLVTPDLPGFEVVLNNRSKCGLRGTWQAVLRFTNMPVPADRVLGKQGKGLKVALSVLDFGRCTLSAGCLGAAKRMLELSIGRARSRVQFGRPIGHFGLIKQKVARMAETVFAMDALLYMAAGLVDRHVEDLMLETAICKLFCSEGLWEVADDTMQIWAGEGYMRDNGIERMFRDARINRVVEGATEVMTAFIALVGIKGVGEELQRVVQAARHPMGNFNRLAEFAHHEWSDIIMGHDFPGLRTELAAEGRTMVRLTRLLARDVERLCRTYREGIIEMQLVQQRVALAVMDLYAMAAVISKLQMTLGAAEGNGHGTLKHDLMLGRGFCHRAAERIQQRLGSLWGNNDEEVIAVADHLLGWDQQGNS
jgi:acyl-CoA dehydrogenase family member 9